MACASPCAASAGRFPPEEVSSLREHVRRAPPESEDDLAPARWTLRWMSKALSLLEGYSPSGVWRVLEALGLRYKRGRLAMHSPDPDYEAKRDRASACVAQARISGGRVVALYLDEFSYYRQPSLERGWSERGARHQVAARLSHGKNTRRRAVGVLDAVTGRVVWWQGEKVGVRQLVAFYAAIRAAYPEAETIYAIQDNWSIHFDARVVEAAEAAGVTLLALPTYAPWLNPIEKLWRRLKQEVLHLHRLSDEWKRLQQRVASFLNRFKHGSITLLRSVGLLPT